MAPSRDQSQSSDGKSVSHIAAKSDVKLTPWDQSVAGASAQVLTKFVLYPLDTWKSRCQARRFGALDEFKGLWTVKSLYRGVSTKLLLYTPYQAVYMASYVQARDYLLVAPPPFGGGVATYLLAGAAAEVAGSIVRLPMEVAKLRLQLGIYKTSLQAFRELCRQPVSFYGYFVPQTLCHDCIFSAFSWLIFEWSRQRLFKLWGTAELPTTYNLALGAATGGLVALATTPLDVLKTRVIAMPGGQGAGPSLLFKTARAMLREEGRMAFWRGATLRVAHLAPSHGLYFCLYEAIKTQISTYRA